MTYPSTVHVMIPSKIDIVSIIAELNVLGWKDYKIEQAAGLGSGYVARIRSDVIRNPSYDKAARLHNFWVTQISA